jgi:ABC-type uncharacterized transport system permease subunit
MVFIVYYICRYLICFMSTKPSKAYLKITMVLPEGRTMPHVFFFLCITSYLQDIKGIPSEK